MRGKTVGKKDARIGEVLMERKGEDQREREVKNKFEQEATHV